MIGTGYDVHQFSENRQLILGGVNIPHTHGLAGHSDADVLCHAIADAVLGAMGKPDIGFYFPPGDPSCKDISSLKILEKCRELLAEENLKLINVDSTLIAEAPKVLHHREACNKTLAALWASHQTGSASKPPPTKPWASSAAKKASPPWRLRR